MVAFLRFWFPLLGYSGIIFYVSSVPSLSTPMPFHHGDKIFHVGEYIPFGILGIRLFGQMYHDRDKLFLIKVTVLLALLYGLSDEFHQFFVEGRSSSMLDVFADTVGGFIGASFFSLFIKRK